MQQLHYLSARTYKDIYISICRVKTNGTDLLAHSLDSYTHITRMLTITKRLFSFKLNMAFLTAKFTSKNLM